MFTTTLGQLVHNVPGALGAAVVSVDGLALEAVEADGTPLRADNATTEYASVCRQLLNVGEAMELGQIRELTIEGPDRTTLIRMLSPRWFVALGVTPGTPPGQGRFQLRIAAPDLAREL